RRHMPNDAGRPREGPAELGGNPGRDAARRAPEVGTRRANVSAVLRSLVVRTVTAAAVTTSPAAGLHLRRTAGPAPGRIGRPAGRRSTPAWTRHPTPSAGCTGCSRRTAVARSPARAGHIAGRSPDPAGRTAGR